MLAKTHEHTFFFTMFKKQNKYPLRKNNIYCQLNHLYHLTVKSITDII